MRVGIRRLTAAAGVATALVLGFATAAQSADPPAPDFGSTLGDTQVTVTGPDPTKFVQVTGGLHFSVALDANGYAYAWGYNVSGQLGDGTTTNRSSPVAVKMPAGVTFTRISAGEAHTLALGSDGKAYAWGYNSFGQLGDGSAEDRSTPVEVEMPDGVLFTQIGAGKAHSLALTSAGKAYAWGQGFYGQLGTGDNADRTTPVAVNTSLTFTQISAGSVHSLALTTAGKAYAWGRNWYGQLGDATSGTDRNSPVPVSTSLTFTQIAAGSAHSLALTSAGKAYAWGNNNTGGLGVGDTTNRSSPTALSSAFTFAQISAGSSFSLALTSAGKTYGWGYNATGQLGTGATGYPQSPVATLTSFTFAKINPGSYHVLALTTAGKAYAWGENSYGPLGDGTTTGSGSTPAATSVPAVTVTGIAFDGTPGTDLTSLGNGKWRATTPPHPTPGKIDVVLNWTLGGVAQTPITFPESFTYVTPEVTITTRAYQESGHTTEIPPDSIIAPGTTLYFVYTIENTGRLPISIQELKREGGTIDVDAECGKRELAPSTANTPGESTTCHAEATL